ncbi:MAG TPA: cytochrome c [Steroidobacteraceae bacterium]|jgi:mono/diheme cytochrome c family protein
MAIAIALCLLILVSALWLFSFHAEIAPIPQPADGTFGAEIVARGAELAAIGNCDVCHTREGGELFAGARPVPTPFGTIYSTNITPDPDTGIGNWSEAAFQRAMREGVSRTGQQLYPAFPYQHFTKVTDDDNRALYAYLMSRKPVRAPAVHNEIWSPLKFRPLIAAWKALFFRPGPYRAEPSRSAEWNRGAYLAEGLGHCGACHTPRNALGAERAGRSYTGARVEGWDAYALNSSAAAPVPWSLESLQTYLQSGWHVQHGMSQGPMAGVTGDLAAASSADIRAMATFIGGQLNSTRAPAADLRERRSGSGGEIYEASCSSCHDGSRALPFGGVDLSLSTALNAPSPRNLINVTLVGLAPPDGHAGPIMPGFGGAISDDQLAALLAHLRARYSDKGPWSDLSGEILAARRALKNGRAGL